LGLLKDVAIGVWQKIKAGADVMYFGIALVFNDIQFKWLEVLRQMRISWAEFVDGNANTSIGEAMGFVGGATEAAVNSMRGLLDANDAAFFRLENGLSSAQAELAGTTGGVEELRAAMVAANAEIDAGVVGSDSLAASLDDVGGGVQDLTDDLDAAETATNQFTKTFTEGMGDAIDYMIGGFKDGFAGLLDIIKNTLMQAVQFAIANPIKLALGIGGTGAAGVASQAMGGGGMLSGLMGGIGALSGGIGSGVAVAVNGIMAGGGLGPAMGAISGGLSMGGAAGIGTAIGAVAVPLLAVAGIFMAFKKTTKDLETGMRVTVDGLDTLVESYKKVRTSRFFGLSEKIADEFAALDDEAADPVRNAVRDLQQGVVDAAAGLGVGAEAFEGFSRSFTLSLKHMSDDEAQAVLQAELLNTQNAFADMIPTLTDFKIEGESTTGTLSRLVASLGIINGTFEMLGLTLRNATLAGASVSAAFIQAFGSIEVFNAASENYYQQAFSDIERVGFATVKMTEAMSDLGSIMPTTIAGFRNLIEQADRVGDVDKVAGLLMLFGDFANIVQGQGAIDDRAAANAATRAANAATRAAGVADFISDYDQENADALAAAATALKASFAAEMEKTRASFEASIDALKEELTGARARLTNSKAIADALSNALQKRVFPSIAAERASLDEASGYLRSLVGMARIDDTDALKAALDVVASPSTDTFETLEDYRRDFMRTSGVIAALEKTASFSLGADEQAVVLLEDQLVAMETQFEQEMTAMQSQLDALLGINESVLSVADAISQLSAARAGLGGGSGAVGGIPDGAGGFSKGNTSEAFAQTLDTSSFSRDQLYLANNTDVLAAVADGRFASGADHFQQFGQFEGRSFAGGGYTGNGSRTGGMDGQGGFMAMMHPQEVVTDLTRSRGGSGNMEMVAELRRLNEKVEQMTAYNRQTTINTGSVAFDTKDIRRNGVQVEPVTGAIFKTDEVA
jgi:hypothetical protein